jgi:ribosomal protein S18 acetylase RimI-like enzyme
VVIALPSKRYRRAGEVLGRAFLDDPLWRETFPDADERPGLLTGMFTGVVKATAAAQGMLETTPGVDAVALWLPPGKDIGFWAMVRSGFALPRFTMGLPAKDRNRMMAVLRQLEERRKALMPDPHWYLTTIGVEPEHQGEGLGSTLLRSGIRRADHEDTSIFLDTETSGNVSFYQHFGFEVIEETTAPASGVPVWLMVRRSASPRM